MLLSVGLCRVELQPEMLLSVGLCRVELQPEMLLSVGLCRVELQPEMVVEVCLSVMTQTWRYVSWGACVHLLLRWILQDLQPAFFTPVSALTHHTYGLFTSVIMTHCQTSNVTKLNI